MLSEIIIKLKSFLNYSVKIKKKITKNAKKILAILQRHLLPHLDAYLAGRKLNSNLKKLEKKEANIEFEEREKEEILKIIKKYHVDEFKRKNVMEDKAKSSLFIIAISITFFLGSFNFINETGTLISLEIKIILALIMIFGVIYLLLSGITSIMALYNKGYYDIYLDKKFIGNYEKIVPVDLSAEEQIKIFYESAKLNQILTNIKSNYVAATLIGIRNGIILITLFFISSVSISI